MPDSFVPRWASAPGETILDLAARQSRDLTTLAYELDLSRDELQALVEGVTSISLDLADRLAGVLGASQRFWLTRDAQYQEDRARVVADRWASDLPLPDMHRWGWMRKATSWQERIELSLDFFGVEDYDEWSLSYRKMLNDARYRTSTAHGVSETATAAWIRQAQLVSSDFDVAPWSKDRLESALGAIKELTRESDPRVFVPELRSALAACGVLVVVLPAPTGCRASGASIAMADGRPLIILSGRYLSDDHFWFTLFHELAHVLFHDLGRASVDEFEDAATVPMDSDERFADLFAANLLIDPNIQVELTNLKNRPREIVSFARRAGTSPGVVVGQMQKLGILAYKNGNSMKRRYRWVETNLEMA